MRLFTVRRFSSSPVTLEPRVSVSCARRFASSRKSVFYSFLFPRFLFESRSEVVFFFFFSTPGGNEPISSDRHDLQVPPLTALPGTTAAREASPLILLSFPFLSCHGGKAVTMVTGSLALIPHTAL